VASVLRGNVRQVEAQRFSDSVRAHSTRAFLGQEGKEIPHQTGNYLVGLAFTSIPTERLHWVCRMPHRELAIKRKHRAFRHDPSRGEPIVAVSSSTSSPSASRRLCGGKSLDDTEAPGRYDRPHFNALTFSCVMCFSTHPRFQGP